MRVICRFNTGLPAPAIARNAGKIFFTRHNGGPVWVDLPFGWPWPKHACFDKPNEPTRSFSEWSAKSSGLKNPQFGIIKRIEKDSKDEEPWIVIKLPDLSRISLKLRWMPPDSSLLSALYACAARLFVEATLVVEARIINDLKSHLDEAEFWQVIEHLFIVEVEKKKIAAPFGKRLPKPLASFAVFTLLCTIFPQPSFII